MKKFLALIATSALLLLSGCNTWSGVKQDAKEAGTAAGKGIEKAGEKIRDISQ
jgi:predicted small secreted protein